MDGVYLYKLYQPLKKLYSVIQNHILVFSYILSILIALIVYFTGGTARVYANFMYIPIVLCSSEYGKARGIAHALFSAILVGPVMPLDIASHTPQEPIEWVIRVILYVSVASVVGHHSTQSKKHLEKIIQNNDELIQAKISTIYALVKLTEHRDDDTGLHIDRVSSLCKHLATLLSTHRKYKQKIDQSFIENIHLASSLHDIGKVHIPDSILLKPGTLTPEEFEVMKTHTTVGAEALNKVKDKYPNNDFIEYGIDIVLYHHEKWDGTGYPVGLKEEEIPLSARIMSLIDVYDALRSKRVYKAAYTHNEAINIIEGMAGSHFDPDLSKVFVAHHVEFEKIYNDFN